MQVPPSCAFLEGVLHQHLHYAVQPTTVAVCLHTAHKDRSPVGGVSPSCSCLAVCLLMMMQVVFSEAVWIGKAEDNPNEKPLPMPASLAAEQVHAQPADYAYGAAAKEGQALHGSIANNNL